MPEGGDRLRSEGGDRLRSYMPEGGDRLRSPIYPREEIV